MELFGSLSTSMNKFVIFLYISVFWKCINARPDLSLGYRYNQGYSSGGGSYLQAPVSSYSPTASGNSYFCSQPCVGQIGNSGFVPYTQLYKHGNLDANVNTDFAGGPRHSGGYTFSSNYDDSQISAGPFLQQTPIVSKHFYVHTAPPDDDEQEIVRHIQIGQPQKNYRVVFINTPSAHSTKAKIIADIAQTEEKTAIYVLSKRNNAIDVKTEVNTDSPINNKPEVFFIKYKTPEEAVHAQHIIQDQYDTLGGTSEISNEGQIPISSVIGALEDSKTGRDIGPAASTNDGSLTPVEVVPPSGTNTQQVYLPTNSHFKFI